MNTSEHSNKPHKKWEKVELSSCFELQNGINFSSEQRGKGLLVLDVLNMFSDDLYVRTDQLYRVDIKVAEDRLLRPGDILFVRSSVKESGVGWPAIFKGHNEPVTNCGFLIRARQISPNLEPRFLVHYLRQNTVRTQMISRAGKVAITNINQGRLGSLKIPIPPIEEQKIIADILDRAEALRAKRHATLAQIDRVPQAIFLEMFGDPITNPNDWPTNKCSNICERITVGIVVKPASYYVSAGVPALRSLNIKPGYVSLDNLVYFSKSDNETKLSKTKLKAGDIVLVRSGQPGTAAVIPPELNGINAIDLLITTPKPNNVNPVFLCQFFNSSGGRSLVLTSQRGQIQKHLNVGSLSESKIPLPPIELQNEFARRITTIEKLKTTYKASLMELDELFASLQYRAFRGEL